MFKFAQKANEIKQVKINQISRNILLDSFVQDWIIGEIQDRLYDKGTDKNDKKLRTDIGKSNGRLRGKLGFYAAYTEVVKDSKQQPINRVTLNDSGKFYKSFDVIINKTFYRIAANYKQGLYDNFQDSYVSLKELDSNVLELNAEQKQKFVFNVFLPLFLASIKKIIT